jgi:hypothetical protein
MGRSSKSGNDLTESCFKIEDCPLLSPGLTQDPADETRMAQSMRQTKPIQKQKRSANPPTVRRFAVFFFIAGLLSHGIHFEISLGRNAKGIGDTIEEGEHRCDVHSLGDLRLAPAVIAEKLHVFGSSSIGRLGHLGDIVEKGSLGRSDLRLIELSFRNGLHCFFVCSLNPQEVCM